MPWMAESAIVMTCVRHRHHRPEHSLMPALPSGGWFTLGKPFQVFASAALLCGCPGSGHYLSI